MKLLLLVEIEVRRKITVRQSLVHNPISILASSKCENSGKFNQAKCRGWMDSGYCKGKYEKFMLTHCKKTCGCEGKSDPITCIWQHSLKSDQFFQKIVKQLFYLDMMRQI